MKIETADIIAYEKIVLVICLCLGLVFMQECGTPKPSYGYNGKGAGQHSDAHRSSGHVTSGTRCRHDKLEQAVGRTDRGGIYQNLGGSNFDLAPKRESIGSEMRMRRAEAGRKALQGDRGVLQKQGNDNDDRDHGYQKGNAWMGETVLMAWYRYNRINAGKHNFKIQRKNHLNPIKTPFNHEQRSSRPHI